MMIARRKVLSQINTLQTAKITKEIRDLDSCEQQSKTELNF